MRTIPRLALLASLSTFSCGGEDAVVVATTGGGGGASGQGSGGDGGGALSGGTDSGGSSGGGAASGGRSGNGGASGSGSECVGTEPTRLRGTVHDPSGTLPLYNVAVYVPNGPLTSFAEGASACTRCADWTVPAAAVSLTNTSGEFVLEGVPSGDVPLVIEIGKWRREVTIPSVAACADNDVAPELTRLPRNQSEGRLPQIAVTRGGSDSLECLLHGLGIDAAEFTNDSGSGRVHLYFNSGGTAEAGTGQLANGSVLSDADTLLASLDNMKRYDVVMLGCSGSDEDVEGAPSAYYTNVRSYAAQGGRILGSHFNVQFIDTEAYPELSYPTIVNLPVSAHGVDEPTTAVVSQAFPRALALSAWLDGVGASTQPGQFPLAPTEHNIDSVAHPLARAWVTTNETAQLHSNIAQYVAFPTPIDGEMCGRMAFSPMHVGTGSADSGKVAFPSGCLTPAANFTAQQKAFAFLFFDLAACTQAEDAEPTPPSL